MSRRFTTLAVPLLALAAACAPGAAPPAAPAPQAPAAPTPAAEVDPAPAVTPEATSDAAFLPALDIVPDRWWMLDPETDNVAGIGVERAYGELLAGREPARTVVVAIIDSGVDTAHVDLRPVLWRNPDEVGGNGVDDDGNGYVDDVRGWNFIGGPDGRNVEADTYEVTRLYAACQVSAEPGGPAAAGDEVPSCARIEDEYASKRAEAEDMLPRIREMGVIVGQVWQILEAQVPEGGLSTGSVRGIMSPRRDVMQAREIYLNLAEHGITPEAIESEVERLENLLEYGLDPAFDPRPIVGDDYDDVTERFYGNPDVTGPDASHGTGVAAIVAGVRDNDSPIAGVADAVRIMAIRAVPNGDERDKDVANAIRYAVDNGAHIINMSFGKPFSPQKSLVDEAVRYAGERGVLLVNAAGNDAQDLTREPTFPNRFFLDGDTARHWIQVGASSWHGGDRLTATFSNYGRGHVDVFAPGVDIMSAAPGDEYRAASGTSFAAPVVTGLAALIMAYFPELDAADVRAVILESATPIGDRTVLLPGEEAGTAPFSELSDTGGIVNAYRAVQLAERRVAERR